MTSMAAVRSMMLFECLVSWTVLPVAEQLQVNRGEAKELRAASKQALAAAEIRGRTNEGGKLFTLFFSGCCLRRR